MDIDTSEDRPRVLCAPLVSDIVRCEPLRYESAGHDKWQPRTQAQWQNVLLSPWKEAHVLDRSAFGDCGFGYELRTQKATDKKKHYGYLINFAIC